MLSLRMLAMVALVVGAADPILAQAPAKPALPEGVVAKRDLAYGPHERNKLDVYRPAGDGAFPLIVWVHGGGWQAGSKASGNRLLPMLLGHGYAVAAINYRLSQHAPFPAQIQDCQEAIRYLRVHAEEWKLNPKKVGVWGGSAGGHLVALLGTADDVKPFATDKYADASNRIQAVCDFYGPTDLTVLAAPNQNKNNPIVKLLGGDPTEKKELATLANPITHINQGDAPVLILHGDKDPLVPLSQSELFIQALKKAGIENELVVIQGGGHGGADFATKEMQEKILYFFDKHLKK